MPNIKTILRKSLKYIINVASIFGMGSFIQDTLFLHDFLIYILTLVEFAIPYLAEIVTLMSSGIEIYRDTVAQILALVGVKIPIIFIDVVLMISLSSSISKMMHYWSNERADRKMREMLESSMQKDGNETGMLKESGNIFAFFDKLKEAKELVPSVASSIENHHSILIMPMYESLMVFANRMVTAIIIVLTVLTILNVDLYYRFYVN